MKKDKLLDAVGMVDEQLLEEMESTSGTHRSGLWKTVLVAAIVIALAVSVAAAGIHFTSKPIEDNDIVLDKDALPYLVDQNGNILVGDHEGQLVCMDVEFNDQAPEYIEKVYQIKAPDGWKAIGSSGGGDGWVMDSSMYIWTQEGMDGQMELHQSLQKEFEEFAENCVDVLYFSNTVQLNSEVTTVAGLEVLKVTVPAVTPKDCYGYTYHNAGGETRLYWGDGDYVICFVYPYWVTDAQAEEIMGTLYTEVAPWSYPDAFGSIVPERWNDTELPFAVEGNGGFTLENWECGTGECLYSDGCFWIGTFGYLYKYDPKADTLEQFDLGDEYMSPGNLFATENYICFSHADSVMRMRKDGTERERIAEGVMYTAVDGNYLYGWDQNGALSRHNVETGEKEIIIDAFISYYLTDSHIYVIPAGNGNYFLRSPKDQIEFERVEVGFETAAGICMDGEDLYLNEAWTYQVYRYKDGEITRLPVQSSDYQVANGQLFYRASAGDCGLRAYNLETGEDRVILEDIHTFSIFEDRYLYYHYGTWDGETYLGDFIGIIDLQTGENIPLDITE